MAAPGLHTFKTGADELAYIRQRATDLGLDPEAAIAVAAHEGVTLPSIPGDKDASGTPTSFGPWQLHAGGKLPAQIAQQGPEFAQQWANAQEGIDYALAGMKETIGNLQGPQAVHDIVYKYELPRADLRAGEYQASLDTYTHGGAPSTGGSSFLGGLAHDVGVGVGVPQWKHLLEGGEPGSPIKGIESTLSLPERAFKFVTSWRFVEVVGGFLLLIVGLALLGKQFGLTPPGAVGAATNMVPSDFQAPPGNGSQQHFRESRAYTKGPAKSERLGGGPQAVYGKSRSKV